MANTKKSTITESLSQYSQKWVALTKDRSQVVYAEKTMDKLLKKINKVKKKRDLIVTYILPTDGYFSPLCL